MVAIILAAGYGTRLWPLTEDVPKALLEVGGETLLQRLLISLDGCANIEEIVIVTNSRFYGQFKRWVALNRRSGGTYVIDDGTARPEDRLGAVGDIAVAIRERPIEDDVFVAASDCLFTFSLGGLFDRFAASRGNWIVVQEAADQASLRDGAEACVDGRGRVSYFAEKPDRPRSNLGVLPFYVYEKATLPLVDVFLDAGGNPDSPGRFPEWLYKRRAVSAHIIDSTWECHDLGTLSGYEDVCAAVEAAQAIGDG